ncbi:hypothetical protein BCR35DRAFT_355662 [Leucosporidium creatinivorum]|uniref:Shikimate dehydrogenase substrate binding N-terminal domain-containing protein n=1 Tax=Leucosporidium creatinivorum TaxID=106004 RepID=A0A1Y2DAA3_9BASI|nr:hypothetical protein BCR35DRAFT_355662 [Leucosporidium creatinivorum]
MSISPEFNASRKLLYVFGYPIAQSKSPLIHSTGYKALDLPHEFSIIERPELTEEIEEILGDEAFGGMAVTMPFKVSIKKLLDDFTPAARQLGAVNTVIPRLGADGKRVLVGDNTDWIGIRNVLLGGLKPEHQGDSQSTGLVIGAGGAARAAVYALGEMGIRTVYLFNRSRSRIEEIIADFASYNKINIVPIASLAAEDFTLGLPLFVVGTVPVQGTFAPTLFSVDGLPPSAEGAITLNPAAFSRSQGGVMLDMAYLPKRTALIRLAEESKSEWSTNPGIMVLLQQAFAQFELWTGLKPPEEEMEARTLEVYEREASGKL